MSHKYALTIGASNRERLRLLGLFSLVKRMLKRDLIDVYTYKIEGSKEHRDRLFLVVSSKRKRVKGHNMIHKKFHLNIRNEIS